MPPPVMEGPVDMAGKGPSGDGGGDHKVQGAAVSASVVWEQVGPEEAEAPGRGGEYSAPSASRPRRSRGCGQSVCRNRILCPVGHWEGRGRGPASDFSGLRVRDNTNWHGDGGRAWESSRMAVPWCMALSQTSASPQSSQDRQPWGGSGWDSLVPKEAVTALGGDQGPARTGLGR